ncbi:MAG TPA: lipopolysaccharide kinase InaA family protein [Thermoanaerobaculia bacterium]|nr:lipopolysaccharide kinase InaA family protein [Thermoanaerobaculia bacterium]
MKRSELPRAEPFAITGFAGEIAGPARPDEEVLRRLLDPGAALESIHWGRNYLYRAELPAPGGAIPVVVKQYREDGARDRLRRALRGSRARRAWRAARALTAAGVPTPEPVLFAEPVGGGGASFFVCRHLPGAVEARHLLRAARAGKAAEAYPAIDLETFLRCTGQLLARLHAAGIWHRDASVGNVLIVPGEEPKQMSLSLVDLARARVGVRLGAWRRTKDLSRLALDRAGLYRPFLEGYWGEGLTPGRERLFLFLQGSFELKNRIKRPGKKLAAAVTALAPRRAHAHIPEAPRGAAARDKVVWDHLSDQPHQHAGRLAKALVRIADLPFHLEQLAAVAVVSPRVRRRYREIRSRLYREAVPWQGVGVAVRPWPADPRAVPAAIEDLGVEEVLLRLHPWETNHQAEEELARELVARGCRLAFALPQNRDLVKDPERWRAAVAELAARFAPYGRTFQVGQAVNRSKWGVWRPDEYVGLARIAREELSRHPGLELIGPGVIDFEPLALAGLVSLRRSGLFFDAVSSLLYVDRRGAPENLQLGFDTVGKVALFKAIAETARNSTGRLWITEVNWPLWEGPHSPAGKKVSVGEEEQADYLVRYYLLALSTGLVERVYWWQLIARGYGLICPVEGGALRRRPAFAALAHLARRLAGTQAHGPLPSPQGTRLYRFQRLEGTDLLVGWTVGTDAQHVALPAPAAKAFDRDGGELQLADRDRVALGPSPAYFELGS